MSMYTWEISFLFDAAVFLEWHAILHITALEPYRANWNYNMAGLIYTIKQMDIKKKQ